MGSFERRGRGRGALSLRCAVSAGCRGQWTGFGPTAAALPSGTAVPWPVALPSPAALSPRVWRRRSSSSSRTELLPRPFDRGWPRRGALLPPSSRKGRVERVLRGVQVPTNRACPARGRPRGLSCVAGPVCRAGAGASLTGRVLASDVAGCPALGFLGAVLARWCCHRRMAERALGVGPPQLHCTHTHARANDETRATRTGVTDAQPSSRLPPSPLVGFVRMFSARYMLQHSAFLPPSLSVGVSLPPSISPTYSHGCLSHCRPYSVPARVVRSRMWTLQ